MGITLEDIAVKANLNIGSVSRILNGKGGGYSAQTRQRVLDTAAELGYQPNMLARALQTGRTNTIALWLVAEEEYSPYFGYLQHCLQHLGAQRGYQMIAETGLPVARSQTQGSSLVNWPVDGAICSYVTPGSMNYLQGLFKRGCPIVCMQQNWMAEIEPYPNTDYVIVDIYAGAKQAIAHLLEAGCQRVAFVGDPTLYEPDPRAKAYHQLMSEVGKKTEYITTSGGTRVCGYEGMKAHVERFGCPDGIFCPNDEFAFGCYIALQEAGIQIPLDALLVGFNGLQDVRFSPTPISSVVIPVEEMCALAWKMLIERINEPTTPLRQVTLSTYLEVRSSSRREKIDSFSTR